MLGLRRGMTRMMTAVMRVRDAGVVVDRAVGSPVVDDEGGQEGGADADDAVDAEEEADSGGLGTLTDVVQHGGLDDLVEGKAEKAEAGHDGDQQQTGNRR